MKGKDRLIRDAAVKRFIKAQAKARGLKVTGVSIEALDAVEAATTAAVGLLLQRHTASKRILKP